MPGCWDVGGCDVAWWVYVDNLGVIGPGEQWREQVLDSAKQVFDRDGLELHEIEVLSHGGSSLGIVIDLELFQTRTTVKRYVAIKQGINAVLNMRKVRGWVIEVILGHCNYFGLAPREILSCFYSCYRFVSQSYLKHQCCGPQLDESWRPSWGIMILVAGEWSWR